MTDWAKFRQKIAKTSWKNLVRNFCFFLQVFSSKDQFDETRISKFLITKFDPDRAKELAPCELFFFVWPKSIRDFYLNIFEAKQFLSNRTIYKLYINM